jgi:hypothetical protein
MGGLIDRIHGISIDWMFRRLGGDGGGSGWSRHVGSVHALIRES